MIQATLRSNEGRVYGKNYPFALSVSVSPARRSSIRWAQPRPCGTTTEADAEAAAGMPDLVKRDFTADRPGVKCAGDITYIHT
jgi:transposase InsO family protein